MPSDQQPGRPRLVADPDQRLNSDDQNDESGSQRDDPQLENLRMAGNPDDDLRIRPIGSVDPMEVLSDIETEEDTAYDQDYDEDTEAAPRGWVLPTVTAVLALLGFAGIIWYAYQWGAGSVAPEELPVIRAESGPSKIRPESPGGLEVPYQETLALNDLQPDPQKPQVERLLPPPETPLPPTTAEVVTPVLPAPASRQPAVPAAPDTLAAPSTPPIPEPSAQTAAVQAPAAKIPAPAGPTPAVKGTGFVVQLASLKAMERTSPEWSRLIKSFPVLLADKQLVVVSVDLAGRGKFFRVQAGYFPNRASADAVCKQLKAKRQDCLVIKR